MEFSRKWPVALALALVLLPLGCTRRPRPPVLRQNLPVFANAREGFRFQPPAGWSQHALSDPSRADQTRELTLVKYKRLTARKPAFLQVSAVNLPDGTDPSTYLGEHALGRDWRRVGQTETLQVGRASATREVFTGYWDRDQIVKEVVTFRRGERVYFFTGIFPVGDGEAQAEVRQAVATIWWDKEAGA